MTLLVISLCTGAAVFIIGLTRFANHELWTTLPTARRHSNVILEHTHTHKKRVQPYPRDIDKVHTYNYVRFQKTHARDSIEVNTIYYHVITINGRNNTKLHLIVRSGKMGGFWGVFYKYISYLVMLIRLILTG